jgi:hypothetical protein
MRAGDLEEAHRSVLSQAEERSAEHAELQIEYNRLRSEHRELRAKEQVRFGRDVIVDFFAICHLSSDLLFPLPTPLLHPPTTTLPASTHRRWSPSDSLWNRRRRPSRRRWPLCPQNMRQWR